MGVAVVGAWLMGHYQVNMLWAVLVAVAAGSLWRSMAAKFVYGATVHARRRAARNRVRRRKWGAGAWLKVSHPPLRPLPPARRRSG